MITLLDIIIAIALYYVIGTITSLGGMYIQYYAQRHIQKIQLKALAKNAPEVEDNRKKGAK